MFDAAGHLPLSRRNIVMHACGDGGENRGAQRAALIGGHNLQRTVEHVAAGLHDDAVFTGDTAQRHHVIDRDALLGEALHNGAGAKGGGGNQPAKQRWSIGCQI